MRIYRKDKRFYVEGAENISSEHGWLAVTVIRNQIVVVVDNEKGFHTVKTSEPINALPKSIALKSAEEENEFFLIHKEMRAVQRVSALKKPHFCNSGLVFVHKTDNKKYGCELFYTEYSNSTWICIPDISSYIRKIYDKCVIVQKDFYQIVALKIENRRFLPYIGGDPYFLPAGMDVTGYCRKSNQVSFCQKDFGKDRLIIGAYDLSAAKEVFHSYAESSCCLSDVYLKSFTTRKGETVWYNSFNYWCNGEKYDLFSNYRTVGRHYKCNQE